jgi:C4-dicarboxylate transporter/malic acid transport protein
MTTTQEVRVDPPGTHRPARVGVWRDLERPGLAFAYITPNWFAAVMGTGIVAVAAAGLPVQWPGLRGAAVAVWALAAALLVLLGVATAVHWLRYRATARCHAFDPVISHFYGAPPMAMLTVGAGALLLGRDVLGLRVALDLDWTLWFAGTITGLLCAVTVPYLMFTRHQVPEDGAFGGWLMPIVPPMVSASTGALLIPYAPAGQAQLTLLLCCYAMFGMSLFASIIITTLIWQRLAVHKVGAARMVPTLWIVLGPLGQSITAANLLGDVAHLAEPAPYGTALKAFGLVYGLPVWGFALLWGALATALTVRTARRHLPFSLTWWSFTFPVGTCVTGTSALAADSGTWLFHFGAPVLFAALVLAWLLVGVRTARGVVRGDLLRQPTPQT